jgi:hypothetical protein
MKPCPNCGKNIEWFGIRVEHNVENKSLRQYCKYCNCRLKYTNNVHLLLPYGIVIILFNYLFLIEHVMNISWSEVVIAYIIFIGIGYLISLKIKYERWEEPGSKNNSSVNPIVSTPDDVSVRLKGISKRSLLFPKEATLNQKIAIVLSMLLAILTIFGIVGYLFLHILINDNVFSALIIPTVVASLLIIIFLGKAVFNETSFVRKYANIMKQGPLKFILSMCLVVPVVLSIFITIALPSTLHIFASEPGDLVVTIKQKSLWYKSRTCDGSIYIEEHKNFMNNKVCGISKNDWDTLVSGDKIRLTGKKSYVGFNYDKYELLTRR